MTHRQIPVYLYTADVARILGPQWTTTRARRWLRRQDATVKRGGRHMVVVDRLRDFFPEIYDRVRRGS